jgi:hypothetical protein
MYRYIAYEYTCNNDYMLHVLNMKNARFDVHACMYGYIA